MKLREHLNQLSINQLDNIAKKLHCVDSNDSFGSKREYIKRITIELDRYLWDVIENKNSNLYIDEKVVFDLKKLCFDDMTIREGSLFILKDLGIVYEGKVLPDDLKDKFIEGWRTDLVSNIDSYSVQIKTSMFMKLILLIGYVEKEQVKCYEDLMNCNIAGKQTMSILVDYLEGVNIISKGLNNYISLNKYVLKLWRIGTKDILNEFYMFYFRKKGLKANLIFKVLLLIQKDSREWVHVSKCDFILEKFREEIDLFKSEGCILSIINNNCEYIQLSPETWFLVTGYIPQAWNIENAIITPDFELFIPYYFNPFIIDTVNCYGELKNRVISESKKGKINKKGKRELDQFNKRYDGDYYLIYNIEKIKEKMDIEIYNNKFLEVFEYIMPDIVKDELSTKDFNYI
ncbi:hypothetical protein G9F73_001580 [Clostridium estertheticum]|uniref:hypothetical protein n=1 Tax=Clostridium estertheticum TaxID=238834 RepID=UPI0013EE73B3|nr:hypothetical protein [Clostridium estertheticum]MBZ9606529.1 hypothetical protein [Clostridium estertheticum]